MASKKHRPEEAVAKLRQVDVLVSQGQTVAEAIRAIGVTEVTYYCIAPGSLDNGLRYAARLKVCSSHAARASSGLRWPFFSISHSAL